MGARGPDKGRPEMPLRSDPGRQQAFLDVLEATGNFAEAARQASPHSEKGCLSTFKNFARDDADFAARIQDALEHFRSSLVKAAITRGRDGYDRPIFQKGSLVGHERVYSDNLLLAELKKHFPADYAERHKHDHRITIQPTGAWQISTEDLGYLTADEKQTLAGLMDKVRVGRGERRAVGIEHRQAVDAEYSEVEDDVLQGAGVEW